VVFFGLQEAPEELLALNWAHCQQTKWGDYNLDKAVPVGSMGQPLREVVMATRDELAAGIPLAGGAIASALLEVLFDKGILSLGESRDVLDRAMKGLAPVVQTPAGFQAAGIIGAMQRGKFTARG
jgi:hypothetical protein